MHVGASRTPLSLRVMFVAFCLCITQYSCKFILFYFFPLSLSLFREMVDAARKALISRVEELTNERSALNLELTSCQETINRLESRTKEMEEETKR